MTTEKEKELLVNHVHELYRILDGDSLQTRVIVNRQLFFNESTGFGSFLCSFEQSEEIVNVAGVFLEKPEEHRTYKIIGEKQTYKGKPTIKSHHCELTFPETRFGNFKFLLSLNKLGRYSTALIEAFGEDAILRIISLEVKEMIKNPLLTSIYAKDPNFERILIEEKKAISDIFVKSLTLNQLIGLELSKSAARKLYELFGPSCFEVLKENPYVILESYEELGYDLVFCDKIAMKFGFKANDKNRLEYGIMHGLNVASQEGHVYMPKLEFIDLLKRELSVSIPNEKLHSLINNHSGDFDFEYFNDIYPVELDDIHQLINDRLNFVADANEKSIILYSPSLQVIEESLSEAIRKELVVEDSGRIYGKNLFEREKMLSTYIEERTPISQKPSARHIHPDQVKDVLKEWELENMQEKACVDFLKDSGGLYILVGPAGAGKTYTIKALIESYIKLYKSNERQVLLLAPTGRAAKRIEESTTYKASTIHRALGMDPINGWTINKNNPLNHKLVIVDEFSMVDTEIAYRLFDAIPEDTKIILVGDTKQLASVGPGNVLKDIIESKHVPVVELDVIKRQQDKSDIIENSVRVINKLPLFEGGKNKDAFVMFKQYNEQMQQAAMSSIRRIQDTMKLDIEQIQILIPQRKSKIGTYYFNHLIQEELNANEASTIIANQFSLYNSTKRKYEDIVTYFKIKDKVINVKNNYNAKWYDKDSMGNYHLDTTSSIVTNGEIGIIVDIVKGKKSNQDKFTNRIIVKVDDKFLFYDDDFDNLELAYAITVHKSQGSQWKAVIYMVSNSHRKMLTNNLMYTAMTRPSSFLVVIGDEKAINFGIENDIITKRYSTLKEYLTKAQS